jgi:hypothetical protein
MNAKALPGAGDGPYEVRKFDLTGVKGLSPRAIELHLGLYEGYVTNLNKLLAEQREAFPAAGEAATPLDLASHARRFAFEYNGVVLHELFFEALGPTGAGSPDKGGALAKAAERTFGGVKQWMQHASALAKLRVRGLGRERCASAPRTGSTTPGWTCITSVSRQIPTSCGARPVGDTRTCWILRPSSARDLFRDGVVQHPLGQGREPLPLSPVSKCAIDAVAAPARYSLACEVKPTAEMCPVSSSTAR